MRLRRKPWIGEAIREFEDFVFFSAEALARIEKGKWSAVFGRTAPLYVEVGTGKGRFITETARLQPDINFIGIEAQRDVAYYAARKVKALELANVRILVDNADYLSERFAPGEVDRFYINFCDPWPKAKHAKRRLTYHAYLETYRTLLKNGGRLHFKTDNRKLFDFSLEQFAEANLTVHDLSYDLHAEARPDNIMTEYEAKFSGLGEKINRCEVSF